MIKNVTYIVNIAKHVFDTQTIEEFSAIRAHFGNAYNEGKLIAFIAVKMLVRMAGLEEEPTRSLEAIDGHLNALVERGLQQMNG